MNLAILTTAVWIVGVQNLHAPPVRYRDAIGTSGAGARRRPSVGAGIPEGAMVRVHVTFSGVAQGDLAGGARIGQGGIDVHVHPWCAPIVV